MANNALTAAQPSVLNASLSSASSGAYGSVQVPSGAPVSTWPAAYPWTLHVDYGNAANPALLESVAITGPASGTGPYTYPCIRGIDGTTAQAHSAGATVMPGISAQDIGSQASPLPGPPGAHNLPWLVVDTSGDYAVVRQGAGGPAYRATGWNFWVAHPAEGGSMSTEEIDAQFAQLRPGSLLRVWASATNPSSMTWAALASSYLDVIVALAKKYGHRCIFTLSLWSDSSDYYGVKTATWITGQQYLHSVYGANSYQDWVTFVCQRYAAEPTVAIYDIMNEPADGTGLNVTAWATFCSTVSGWIKAIVPGALVYMGTNIPPAPVDTAAHYETVIASLDLASSHDYQTNMFTAHAAGTWQGVLTKPLIADEYGFWAKGHYGAFTDSDLDDNGLPAMHWEAQARAAEIYLASVFRTPNCFAALIWSMMDKDAGNGPYGNWNGTGGYDPVNQARIRDVIRDFPVTAQPYFTVNTLGSGNMLGWTSSGQALRFPDGTAIYSGASNGLQQYLSDAAAGADYNAASASANGPVCRHGSVIIRGRDWPSLQFSAAQYFTPGTAWQDSGSATYFFVIVPTALPTGSGSTTYGYLISPTSNTTAAAIRVTSAGTVSLEKYSAATGGTVVLTSTAALTVNVPALVMVSYTGTTQRIDINTVIATGTSSTTYTAAGVQVGAAADATNGFTGHLLEVLKYKTAASEAQTGTVNAYLTRKYGLMS